MPDVKKAGGIIYAENIHAYLLIYNGEKWGFPKGSMNKQETEEECAVREIYEETGYVVENIEKYTKKKLVLISFYIIEIEKAFVASPVDTNEVKDIRWFTEYEIINMHQDDLLVSNVKSFFRLKTSKSISEKIEEKNLVKYTTEILNENKKIDEQVDKSIRDRCNSFFSQKCPSVIWNDFNLMNKNINVSFTYHRVNKLNSFICTMNIIDTNTNETYTFSDVDSNKKTARLQVIRRVIRTAIQLEK